jgi:general secretion pathway protein K
VPLEQTRLDQYLEEGQTAEGDAANATLSGSIVDAQSHYNLRNLVVNGAVNALEVAGFERLLASLRLDPALAQATASMMLVSEPKTMNTASSGTQSSSTGTQSSSTATQTQSSVTQATTGTNGQSLRLLQVDDLLAVPGFTPEAVEKLRDFVIFLPRPTPVNINTAPAEVLAAKIDKLSTADAAALVAARKIASFRDLGDVRNRMAGRDLAISASQISFSTGYFLVNGNVSMRRAGLDVQALIERNGLTTRLVWVREK